MDQTLRSSSDSFDDSLVEQNLLGKTSKFSSRNGVKSYGKFVILHLVSLSIGLLLGAGVDRIDCARSCAREGFWRAREFETAKNQLSTLWKEKLYDARIIFNASGDMVRPPSNPEYVGEPTREMDLAWKEILPAVTVWITPEEEKLYPGGRLAHDPEYDLYKGQLSVTHELHCVNMLRQYVSLDHYPELAADPRLPVHIEHCLDRLRLGIMCAGDMTVEPIKYADDLKTELPVWPTVHTCRDFDAIREWTLKRDAAHPERKYENAARLRGQVI